MFLLSRPKYIFTAIGFAIALLVASLTPFFSNLKLSISVLNFLVAQGAFSFLFILVAYSRANYKQISKLCLAYLLFFTTVALVTANLPLALEHRLLYLQNSSLVLDLLGIVFVNILACVYLSLGYRMRYISTDTAPKLIANIYPDIEPVSVEIPKEEVSSTTSGQASFEQGLFKMPFMKSQAVEEKPIEEDFEAKLQAKIEELITPAMEPGFEKETSSKLEQLEDALLRNLDPMITEALCMDKFANRLDETVFKWNDVDRKQLINYFNAMAKLNRSSFNTGNLQQILLKKDGQWSIYSKCNGNYMALKTEHNDPMPLLDTSVKTAKVAKHFD